MDRKVFLSGFRGNGLETRSTSPLPSSKSNWKSLAHNGTLWRSQCRGLSISIGLQSTIRFDYAVLGTSRGHCQHHNSLKRCRLRPCAPSNYPTTATIRYMLMSHAEFHLHDDPPFVLSNEIDACSLLDYFQFFSSWMEDSTKL